MARCGIPGDQPDVPSLTRHGASSWWTGFSLLLMCLLFIKLNKPELMEHSLTGDSSKDSKIGSSQGEPLCSVALQGATKQNLSSPGTSETLVSWEEHLSPSSPSSADLKMLAEKAGTLDLKNMNKNNSGATKKGARKARLADALAGDSAGKQSQQGFVAIS